MKKSSLKGRENTKQSGCRSRITDLLQFLFILILFYGWPNNFAFVTVLLLIAQ